MAQQITIANDKVRAVISTIGAELKSLTKDNKEILWEGNPCIWAGQAPVLFPMCGGLKDDKYVFEGKEYTMLKHGFGRMSEFEVEYSDDTSAVFLLCANDETKKQYPFDFEFRIRYTLCDNTLKVDYDVTNTGDGVMYYSVGAHVGYACPEGIEEYSIVFECEEDLKSNILIGNLLDYNQLDVMSATKELPLKNEYFAVDALVFTNIKSRKVWLKNNKCGKVVEVAFDNHDYLLLWTMPGGFKYICIEPWTGLPDFVDSEYDFTAKKGITKLDASQNKVYSHTITLM